MPNQVSADFSGTWQTNFAVVTLQQVGNQVSGTYQGHGLVGNYQISGNVEGKVLEGHFKGGTTNLFRFVISDGMNSFDGFWSDDGVISHQWCRVRTGVLPDGCGYSGRWGFSSPLAASDAYVVINQSGTQIDGSLFFNSSHSCHLSGAFKGANIEGVCSFEDGSGYTFKWRRVGNDFTQFQGILISNGNVEDACGWRDNAGSPVPCRLD